MTALRPTSGRKMRRDFPITGFVGPNGSGKTLAAVWDCLPALEAGRPLLSTVRILDYRNPRPCELFLEEDAPHPDFVCPDQVGHDLGHQQAHPLWEPFTRWEQLLDWSFGDVLMDEVTGVASSRETHAMPGEVANHLNQMRRGDVVVRWTAPAWARADKIIRECSQLAVSCRGFVPKSYAAPPGEPERIWRQRRLFVWRSFDGYAFEDFTVNTRDRLKPMGTDYHWGPGSVAFSAYDTFAPVLAIGTVNVHGRCMTCGGSRSVPKCSCDEAPRRRRSRAPRAGAPLAGPPEGAPVDDVEHDHRHTDLAEPSHVDSDAGDTR